MTDLLLLFSSVAIAIMFVMIIMFGPSIGAPQSRGNVTADKDQGNVTKLSDQALSYYLQKNYSGALTLYKKSLAIDPYNYYTYTDIGMILYHMNNYTVVIQYVNKALAINPNDIHTIAEKGFVLSKFGQYSVAITCCYDKVLSMNPLYPKILDDKAANLIHMRNYTGAISAVNKTLKLDPRDEYAYYNKAIALTGIAVQEKNIGALYKALKSVNQAISINPSDKSAKSMQVLLAEALRSYTFSGDKP